MARVLEEHAEQAELGPRQLDQDAAASHLVGIVVQLEIGVTQCRPLAAGLVRRSTERTRATTSSRLNGLRM